MMIDTCVMIYGILVTSNVDYEPKKNNNGVDDDGVDDDWEYVDDDWEADDANSNYAIQDLGRIFIRDAAVVDESGVIIMSTTDSEGLNPLVQKYNFATNINVGSLRKFHDPKIGWFW